MPPSPQIGRTVICPLLLLLVDNKERTFILSSLPKMSDSITFDVVSRGSGSWCTSIRLELSCVNLKLS
uniref:Uncharacterized protein n=1 Tax=Triticum urartu TaxID=4572 RepID=A0A8R7PPS3_TRIUA